MRLMKLFAAAAALVALAAGEATASNCRCGGGGSGREGGPIRRAVQHVRDRIQERREARSAAACPGVGFPAAPPAEVVSGGVIVAPACTGGKCPAAR